MAKQKFHCSLVTPEGQIFDGQVDSVVIPAHDGEIGILWHRAPMICKLGAGAMRIRVGDDEQRWFIDAGFAQVRDNNVIVLTEQALRPDQIDPEQARAMLEEAQHIKPSDTVSSRKKARLEEKARAQLRMAG
jgi:F-type H+-transporting ATPase subunit epsilon